MPSPARNSLATDIVKRYLHNKAAVVGAVILIVILFGIICSHFLYRAPIFGSISA